MRRHWFFDFDGTLCDTDADIREAWRAAIASTGRTCARFDAVYRTGPTLDQVVRMLFDDATPELVEQIRAAFRQCYDCGGFPQTRIYDCIPPWLAALKSAGAKIYVATNKRWSALVKLMEKFGWDAYFDGYWAFDKYDGERLAKGELLLRAMQERGIAPEEAVMVGDTLGDVEAGRYAGMRTIACAWGYGAAEDLAAADAAVDAAGVAALLRAEGVGG